MSDKTDSQILLSLNCAKGNAETHSFLNYAASSLLYSIILLQEPWLDQNNQPPNLTGFEIFTPCHILPKVVILIRRSANLAPTLTFTHGNSFIGVQLNTSRKPITIYNFYSPGNPKAIFNLFHTFKPDPDSIITGDFNLHHDWWYAEKADEYDKLLREDRDKATFIIDKLLTHSYTLNSRPGTPTHFPRNGQRPTIIDLTFSNGEGTEAIRGCALGDSFTSDHLSTQILLDLQPPQPTPSRQWKKADWKLFESEFTGAGLDFSKLSSPPEIDRAVEALNHSINQAIDVSIPKFKGKKTKSRGWWTKELKSKQQQTRHYEKLRQRNPTNPLLQQQAKDERIAFKRACREQQQRYTIERLQKTDSAKIWKVLTLSRPTHTRSIPPLDGTSNFTGKCDILRTAMFPPPKPNSTIPPIPTPKMDLSATIEPITINEISRAISQCNLASAPGHDKYPYAVIAQVHKASPSTLTNLFNASIDVGHYPHLWKHANCVVIPKEGKSDYSAPKSYRPISLLSNTGKVLEKIMAKRVARAAVAVGAMSSTQYGAVEQRSAIDALFALLHPASKWLQIPKKTTGGDRHALRPTLLANDISGAFNNTDPACLIQLMRARKMPNYMIEWTQSFTQGRTLSFCFDGKTEEPQDFAAGLPQGSPISPVLFLIYAQCMLESRTNNTQIDVSYVDDDGALQGASTPKRAAQLLKE